MEKNYYKTIVIGGGPSGIGCADTLTKHGQDFILISPNIGGRISTSLDGSINYGAYIILSSYKNTKKFMVRKRWLNPMKLLFHDTRKHSYSLFVLFRFPVELYHFLINLIIFKRKYFLFEKRMKLIEQKELIQSDKYIKNMYGTSAHDFAVKSHFRKIATKIFQEASFFCSGLSLSEISALDFMRISLGFIMPAYEFEFDKCRAVRNFSNRIVNGKVVKITESENFVEVITEAGSKFKCERLVLAVSPDIGQNLLNLKEIKKAVSAYVYHIRGNLLSKWRKGKMQLFSSNQNIVFIEIQHDGSYLLGSLTKKVDFSDIFDEYTILNTKSWHPAFNIVGSMLTDLRYSKRIFLAGDYNLIGIEVSYLTGVWAANQTIV